MAKKSEVPEIDISEELDLSEGYDYVAPKEAPEIAFADFIEEVDPKGEPIKAGELVNQMFRIRKLRRFNSAYEGQDYVYFAVVQLVADDSLRNVVLGGQAVVASLDIIAAQGVNVSIVARLEQHEGGQFGQYYVLA